MSNEWDALDNVPEDGLYAIIVTAGTSLVPVASGYAKTIANALAERHSERVLLGIRLGQDGTGAEGEIVPSEADVVQNWIEGVQRPRRSGNKPSRSAVLYVERFDLIPDSVIRLLHENRADIDVILVGAVDESVPPSNEILAPFDKVRIFNIPSEAGSTVSTAEMQLRADK